MWDYAISRAPVRLPQISDKSVQETPFRNILEPVKELILPSDSESSSGVLDAFEELHRDSFLWPISGKKRTFLTKHEADLKTVESFTKDFKETMTKLRRDLKIDDNLTVENLNNLDSNQEKWSFFKTNQSATQEVIIVELDEPKTETSNSAVWNMIEAYKRDHFTTSPMLYNVYDDQPEDHYLKRPNLAWHELEMSRRKCEQWLNNCDFPKLT